MPGRIRPVKFQIRPGMKYWSNWVEIHCMPPWSNWVSSQWNQLASISMDLLPIWPGMKYCSNWVEIHGFTPNSTGHEILLKLGWNSLYACLVELGIIPMNLLPFWAVFLARSNSTGHEILLKMDWNSLRLHCIPPWSNWVSSQWIQLDLLPIWAVFLARSNSTGLEILLKLGWNSWIYSQFDWAWNTAQIGYHLYGFTPILSSISCSVEFQIRPGMKYCSKWVEIHGFTPSSPWSNWVSSQWIQLDLLPFWAVFLARSNSTGHEILLKMGVNSLRLWPPNSTGHKFLVKLGGNCVNSTGHKLPVKLGGNSLRLHHRLMKNKYKVTQYIWSRFGQQISRFY